MIRIVLAGAPFGKERVRFVRQTGRTFTPERTVNYEGLLALAGQKVMNGAPPLDGPLRLEIVAYFPIAASWSNKKRIDALTNKTRPTKKPDFDNIGKIVGDALNQVVWIDDAQIVDGSVSKFYSDTPRIEITVYDAADRGIFG